MSRFPKGNMTLLTLTPVEPYDFALSVRVARSFEPKHPQGDAMFNVAVRIRNTPTRLELRQAGSDAAGRIRVYARQGTSPEVKRVAEWIICAELDLQPFYRVALSHPTLALLIEELHGLKPLRPASLFEMLIIAVTEQQISMTAAYHIRARLVAEYGEPVDGLWAFPTAERLSGATVAELMRCGLSQRKAEYLHGLATRVATGQLDLERMQTLPDEAVRTMLLRERGLGPWSAEYVLIRGLSRPDRVPADDLGIRTMVGRYLGNGERLTAQGVMRKLAHFKPYRGLAVFYLLAHARLEKLNLDEER